MKKLFSPDQRTSFKPYLIEFFMILLAITAGFFVENFREAQAEKAEAKQYMNSLLHDLKLDRQILEFNRGLGDIVLSSTDSLVAELGRRPLKGREQKLYHYFMLSNNFYAEYFNKTMTQLEASGKFRIIQKSAGGRCVGRL
ncbi:MAG: hypothetical protein H7Y31_08255 [Chitinophagaceae bacterium]|nr:hypothetical protein [Chitinophagaceae bacterium]